MAASETMYVKSGEVDIAYQVDGDGPIDLLLFSPWVIPMDAMDEEPSFARVLQRFASFGRVIRFDRRGVGLSDPVSHSSPPTLEQWMADALAVMDAVRSERAALLGLHVAGGGPVATLLAASHPERTRALILVNSSARACVAPDYPWGLSAETLARVEDGIEQDLRGGSFGLGIVAPSVEHDGGFREWFLRSQRRATSPSTARLLAHVAYTSDVRAVLPAIAVPTLVLHRKDNRFFSAEHGRYLAAHIPAAKYVELPGEDHLVFVGDTDALLDEIEEFLTGVRRHDIRRILVTVLFTDIMRSTELAVDVGDRRWGDLLDRHDRVVRRQLARFAGTEIKTTGDGVLATFDGPARAIHCACAIRDVSYQLGLHIRAGLHTGEVEVRNRDVAGIAVHIAARVQALASSDEVLVSRTVTDLVAGSGIGFADRGAHKLKGVPGTWRLFAVEH